jgi:hypothetical protein
MSFDDRFRVNSPKVVHETIDGEVVIIHLDTGCYYSLDGVGAVIWDRLDHGASLGETGAWLGQQYPANQLEAESTVARLVGELQTENLIVALNGPTASPNGRVESGAPLPVAFQSPVLHKHTDMQDLLLLDPIHEVDETGWPSIKKDAA